ncbi:MAG: hypothetical protein N2Z63_07660 [Thiobacillaceae bacterium]|nr:hypothetical protein [Thiobacillaceae bacterium]
MLDRAVYAVLGLLMLIAGRAHAFGINDLIYIGIRAGAELAGAAIDKGIDAVKESLRDAEAEARERQEKERQLALQLQRQIEEIEAQPGLRPLDKERAILKLIDAHRLAREMEDLVRRAEELRRAQRDSLFTLGGIAGVIGEAALSSPSMVMKQAEIMAKNPVYRTQIQARNKAIMERAEIMASTGVTRERTRAAIAGADLAMAQASLHTPTRVTEALPLDVRGESPTKIEPEGQKGGDPFAIDLGRSVWIEFEDAPYETERLRAILAARGHRLAAQRDSAEVIYLIQGEYTVAETRSNEGLTRSIGQLLENPSLRVEPIVKSDSSLGRGLGRLLLGVGGARPPSPTHHGYKQEALLVIARIPRDGVQTRVSALQRLPSGPIEAHKLARWARDELYATLGF